MSELREFAAAESFRQMVEATTDIVCRVDRDGVITYVNPAVVTVTGLPRTHFLGRGFDELGFDAGLMAQWTRSRLEVMRCGEARKIEYLFPGAQGPVWLETSVAPERAADGSVSGVVAFTRDVSARVAAQRALAESEQRFRLFADNTSIVFLVLSADCTQTLFANAAYERVTGLAAQGFPCPSAFWLAHVHEKDSESVRRQLQLVATSGGELEGWMHFRLRRSDGELRWLRARCTNLGGEAEERLIGAFVEDVTERRAGEALRIARDLAQRDALVREVHHRIKNILQGVMGLLRDHAERRPELSLPLEDAIGRLQSMAIVHGLQGEGVAGRVSFCIMTEEIAHSVGCLSKSKVMAQITDDRARTVVLAESEAVAIALAIFELLTNAVKHRRQEGAPVRVTVFGEEHSIVLHIANEGMLPAEFDYERGVSLGTGLHLVRSLMPRRSACLKISCRDGVVETRLELQPPVICAASPETRMSELAGSTDMC